jgi:hypothetical protein
MPVSLGIVAVEDKIVQQAVVTILNQIYEVDFMGFSYGFRPGRSPHQALDALTVGIQRKKVNWILDADVLGFFDNLSHEWALKFIEHRVPSPVTSINCASSANASIDCGVTYWFVAVNARGRSGRSLLPSSTGGYQHPVFCTLTPTPAFTPPILHKSRMRRRARTDLSGGRSVMSVPTGSTTLIPGWVGWPMGGNLPLCPDCPQYNRN